ncbi:hypothetical protein K439DRAFT_1617710 [Ramaria rubella]|nr:hypothetical protein K439DRAFT_1617710 [Ramaria rubella]
MRDPLHAGTTDMAFEIGHQASFFVLKSAFFKYNIGVNAPSRQRPPSCHDLFPFRLEIRFFQDVDKERYNIGIDALLRQPLRKRAVMLELVLVQQAFAPATPFTPSDLLRACDPLHTCDPLHATDPLCAADLLCAQRPPSPSQSPLRPANPLHAQPIPFAPSRPPSCPATPFMPTFFQDVDKERYNIGVDALSHRPLRKRGTILASMMART